MKRIKTAASASKLAWLASSVRVEQNIADMDELENCRPSSLQPLWDSYKSVLRSPSTVVSFQSVRKSRKEFEQNLYNPSHLSRFVQDGESDEDEDDAHDGGGHDPADAGARFRCQLLREFIVGALQPHTFFSLPQKPVGDAPAKLAFYQLLDAGSKGIFVDDVGSDASKTGLLKCAVQPLEV